MVPLAMVVGHELGNRAAKMALPSRITREALLMRLFRVAPSICAAMLRALVMENFLSRAGDGLFVRSITD